MCDTWLADALCFLVDGCRSGGVVVLVELGLVEQRHVAVLEVLDGVPVTEVTARAGVSRQTVHRWLKRYAARGLAGLVDGSKVPGSCPHQMAVETGVDDHSRFCVSALVVARATARPTCEALSLAMRRHGVPEQILTDNGKVFTGRFGPGTGEVLFDRICRENGIKHILTAPRSSISKAQRRTRPR